MHCNGTETLAHIVRARLAPINYYHYQVKLDTGVVNVKGNWCLKENRSVKKALLCSPSGVKPALKFSCKSFFEDEPEFKKLMQELSLGDCNLAEEEEHSEAGVVTYPGYSMHMNSQSPKTPPPPSKSLKKTLSRNASKALAQLKKQQG